MPLHLTKIAFQSESPATLKAWLESHADEARLTTRYLPKRLEEMDGGSLYWIHGHALVGRSPILGFQETGQGRYWIRLAPRLIPVRTAPKRAHQGWRYLKGEPPRDLAEGEEVGDVIPGRIATKLQRLGLI